MGGLRGLGVSQQVALLFLTVFGVLALVTVVALARSFRERSAAQGEAHERFKRDLRALWVGAALFWVAWVAGGTVSTLLFGLVSFLALREFVTLTHTRRADHRSLLLAFFVVLPLQYVLVATRAFNLFTVFIPVYVFFAIPVVSAFGNDPQRFLERTAKIQWGIMVCVYGMSHAPAHDPRPQARHENERLIARATGRRRRRWLATSCTIWPTTTTITRYSSMNAPRPA